MKLKYFFVIVFLNIFYSKVTAHKCFPIDDDKTSQGTTSVTEVTTTTTEASCTFGTATYDPASKINGIAVGNTVGFRPVYVAFIQIDNVIVPGSLQSNDSMAAGFSFGYNDQVNSFIQDDVTYLTQIPGCVCKFVPKNTLNSKMVTFNNGTVGVGKATVYDATYDYSFEVIGSIDIASSIMHHINMFSYEYASTEDYQQLICEPGEETTTTVYTTTTIPSDVSQLTESIDEMLANVDELITSLKENFNNLLNLNETFANELLALIEGENTPANDKVVLEKFIQILSENSGTPFPNSARKKRETAVTCGEVNTKIDEAQSVLTVLYSHRQFLDSMMTEFLELYVDNAHVTLPSNTFQLMESFYASDNQLKADTEKIENTLNELNNLSEDLCKNFTTTTTETTTETSTTALPVTKQCGFWMTYNLKDSPTINGFNAGISRVNSTIYIGRTWYSSQFVPGRIETDEYSIYTSDSQEVKVDSRMEYLVVPNDCVCSWVDPNAAVNSDGLVTIPGPDNFMIGRVNISATQSAISRVASDFSQWYANLAGDEVNDIATEVLVCEGSGLNNVQPTFTNVSLACGGWMTYKNDAAPTFNGFSIGNSRENTSAWIGRGYYNGEFIPGRVQIESPTGVYVPYGGEVYLTNQVEYLVVPVGCECFWADISQFFQDGIIYMFDPVNPWLVGLFTNDNYVSVSKLNANTGIETYVDANGAIVSGNATVALVCAKR